MFSFMKFSSLVDAIRQAKRTRSVEALGNAAVEIAALFGYSTEAALVVAIVQAGSKADFDTMLLKTSDLLLDIRGLFFGPARMSSDGGKAQPVPELSEQHKATVGTMCEALSAELAA